MTFLSEAALESLALDHFATLGYAIAADTEIGPDGTAPEREAYAETILWPRLTHAVHRLNPTIPPEARADALRKLRATEHATLPEENRRFHTYLTDGIPVEFFADDGTIRGDQVRLINFENIAANNFLATSQFTVIERGNQRRPDIVVFVNGLPLAIIELKAPGSENATLVGAYNQLQTYKSQIPSLFRANAVLVTSDGITARIGSLTASQERFMPWRTTDGATIAATGQPELATLLAGVFHPARFLDLIRNFTVFANTGAGLVKILAGYHQFHAVHVAIAKTIAASATFGNRRIGVIWHTQGSGKSLLMAFYVGQLVRLPELENPTILVLTDRNDLDNQLFTTFAACRDLIRQTPIQADSREALRAILSRASGGVIFTTIQKFAPAAGESDYPMLSDRANIVVIADEAHRSQYGFKAKFARETGEIAYGFAKYLRDALPRAAFIGFTGTPIEHGDINTPAIFGDYIDIYDISRAVHDGATVPIYYQSRLARITLPDEEKPRIDAEIEALTEDEAESDQERLKRKWATTEALVGSRNRLALVAADLVRHLEDRLSALAGKAIAVCMSRRICVALYDHIVAIRPDWHSDDDATGMVKIVMTGAAADPPSWQPHLGGKSRLDLLAKRAKDPDDTLKLVIVRDMWLTGFDAPPLHTMYIDKPMRGHGLMQAIARVNRVFRDKPAGLIVDYIGIAQNLKAALSQYSASDRREAGIDEAEAIAALIEKFDIVHAMFHGFDYASGLAGPPHQRLVILAQAIDWVLAAQHRAAARETTKDGKRTANRRFQDAVLALSKAFALASATDEARAIRDDVGFFQAVRAALVKSADPSGTATDREFAIRQLLDRAVLSTDIVDILAATGIASQDISILSDTFLAEIQQVEAKNLALEALRKLLNDEIRSRGNTNIVETRRFSERLEAAIARYHNNAITTVEVLQELVNLGKDMRAARLRGEEAGLTPEEIAFYDALAENQSAVDIMGNDALKAIAQILLVRLKASVTVDWSHRESARARMRVLVKRILREHGYPPDLQSAAIQTVLRQAEALSASWQP